MWGSETMVLEQNDTKFSNSSPLIVQNFVSTACDFVFRCRSSNGIASNTVLEEPGSLTLLTPRPAIGHDLKTLSQFYLPLTVTV
jgi:hypothetical protein